MIPYDHDFLLSTLPATRKGTATISPGRGVKIHRIYYWSDAFRDPELERRPLDVRYDPFDAGIAYAFVGGQWVQCHSEYYAVLHGRSEKEIMLATKELRRRCQLHSAQFSVTAHQLAAFLRSVEAEEVLLSQRLRDHASQAIRADVVTNKPAPSDQSSAHDKAIVSSTAEQMIGECKIYGEL